MRFEFDPEKSREVRRKLDSDGEHYHLVTAWKSTEQEEPDFEDHGTEAALAPADRTKLLRVVALPVNDVNLIECGETQYQPPSRDQDVARACARP
jgi:hypothetical protein